MWPLSHGAGFRAGLLYSSEDPHRVLQLFEDWCDDWWSQRELLCKLTDWEYGERDQEITSSKVHVKKSSVSLWKGAASDPRDPSTRERFQTWSCNVFESSFSSIRSQSMTSHHTSVCAIHIHKLRGPEYWFMFQPVVIKEQHQVILQRMFQAVIDISRK